MLARLGYFARETIISLRRNLLMTLAGVLTVFVTLLLAGSALTITRFVDNGVGRWSSGTEMEIFMKITSTQQQSDAVRKALEGDSLVKSFTFISHEKAWEAFKTYNQGNPSLVQTVRPEDLPTSYRVVPKDAKLTETVANEFRTMPGVDSVETAEKFIKQFTKIADWLQVVLFGIALALLASSVFLIVNTIRLATFARRREIEVMKLVGASNWFVRIPFMAEGLIQGLLGGAIAFGFVYFGALWFRGVLHDQDNFLSKLTMTNGEILGIGFLLLVVGAGIGIVGSLVGLRKFLDA